MKITNQILKVFAVGSVAMSLTLLTSISVAGNLVLGDLTGRNDVSVVSSTGTLPVDGIYTYFGGDKIVTGKTAGAGLTLNSSGNVYVGENSAVTVDKSGSEYSIDLESGTVAFSFEEYTKFRIQILDSVVQSTDPSQAISGLVTVDADGGIVLKSIAGDLSVSADDGTNAFLSMGETYSNLTGSGELVDVQVTTAGAGSGVSGFTITAIVVALLALVEANDANDDNDALRNQINALTGQAGQAGASQADVDAAVRRAVDAVRRANDAQLAQIRAAIQAASGSPS